MADEVAGSLDWKPFLKRHMGIIASFFVAAVALFIGSIYVFSWSSTDAVVIGIVPSTLVGWTIGTVVSFLLHIVFWELMLIGIPAAVGAALGWVWWKRLPTEERGTRLFGGGQRSGGDGAGVILFIAFCAKVYVDGNWNAPIASWTVGYVAGSIVTIVTWALIILGIPLVIGLLWWLNRQMKMP